MNKSNKKVIIAMDIGGTTGKIDIVDLKGNILHKFVIQTKFKDEVIPSYNKELREKCQELGID
jgi:predicted NBD/HSP70 family sugar kinase